MTQARLVGVNLFWALITVSVTLAGFRSAYIPMVLLLCSLASTVLNSLLGNGKTTRKWIYIHLLFQLPALLWTTNFYNVLIELFVPITGRFGGSRNPEMFISLLAAAFTLLCCSYLIPFIAQLRSMMSFTAKLSAITVLTLLVALSSPLGFPYQDESTAPSAPTPQRHYVTVSDRELIDHNHQNHFRALLFSTRFACFTTNLVCTRAAILVTSFKRWTATREEQSKRSWFPVQS